MSHIRYIDDTTHAVVGRSERARESVGSECGPQITDMLFAVDRRSAGVHERKAWLHRDEELLRAREGIGEHDARCERLSTRGYVTRDAGEPLHALEEPTLSGKENGEYESQYQHNAHNNPESIRRIDDRHAFSAHSKYPRDETEWQKDEVNDRECFHDLILRGT